MWPGQVGFPGFPVESCGFGRQHVVLFRENHIVVAGESGEVGNPGTLGVNKMHAEGGEQRLKSLRGKDKKPQTSLSA